MSFGIEVWIGSELSKFVMSVKHAKDMKNRPILYDKNGKSSTVKLKGQIQNVKSARIYVFGDADVEENELLNGDVESCELKERRKSKYVNKRENAENPVESIERPVMKDDTLQKIAVKYCCKVADLKRINNLITNQDFFALKYIKVPVMKHSSVMEKLKEEIQENAGDYGLSKSSVPSNGAHSVLDIRSQSVSDSDWGDMEEDIESEKTELLVQTVSIKKSVSSQSEDAKNFLKKMDADIKNILSSTKSSNKRDLTEVKNSLMCRRIYPLENKEGYFGVKLGTIIVVLVIVAIVVPLFYYFYIKS